MNIRGSLHDTVCFFPGDNGILVVQNMASTTKKKADCEVRVIVTNSRD